MELNQELVIKIKNVILKTIKKEYLNKNMINDILFFVIDRLYKYNYEKNDKVIKILVKTYFYN